MGAMSHLRPTRHTPRLAAAALGTALALTLVGCGSEAEPTSGGTTAADPATPSDEPTPSDPASTTPESPSGEATTVPVYFVGDAPLGLRLFREFQDAQGEPGLAAARLLVAGDSDDPDYRTLLEGLTVTDVTAGDGTIDVTATADGLEERPSGMSAKDAEVAVQSLVYTVQGALGSRDPVRLVGDDAPTRLLGVDVSTPVAAADQLDVLNLVSITSPAEDETVSGTFTAEGLSSSFEATTPWEVRDSSGAVVLDGSTTAEGWMDRLYPWEAEVDVSSLAPGDYVFAALTDDPSGGGEGAGASEDTRTVTVG